MKFKRNMATALITIAVVFVFCACTGTIDDYFSTDKVAQSFVPVKEIQGRFGSGKVDVLFAIDNSGSMDPSQTKLLDSFDEFSETYLTAGVDVCVAIITSQAYLHADYYPNHSNPNTDAVLTSRICTKNPDGSDADIDSVNQAFADAVNAIGTSGNPRERIMQSIWAFVEKNEVASNQFRFFRENATRVITMISDEDEQSVAIDPGTNLPEDTAIANNDQAFTNGALCARTVGSYNYSLDNGGGGSYCLDTNTYGHMTPSWFLQYLRDFFTALDGSSNSNNLNLAAVSIQTEQTAMQLRKTGNYDDAFDPADPDIRFFYDAAEELEQLVDLAGEDSFKKDIATEDYFEIFQELGTIISKVGSFELQYCPDPNEDVTVQLLSASTGQISAIDPSEWSLDEYRFRFSNPDYLNTLSPDDVLQILYTPFRLDGQTCPGDET